MTAGRAFCRVSVIVSVLGWAVAGLASGARAESDCNAEIGSLSQKRQAFIDKLNEIAKESKGKLDPVASCPALQGLVKSEVALVNYLQANATWCNVPEDTVNNLKANNQKSVMFAQKACAIAEQAKKAQQQQAAGGGLGQEAPKLPAGPL